MIPLIEVQELSKHVNLPENQKLTILENVSLTVNHGEHVAIVGRSGSGKSTLLNILGLLDDPSTGTYLYQGQSSTSLSPRSRASQRGKGIGFIFQQFNLLPGRSALENVQTPLIYARGREFFSRKQRALTVFEKVGLEKKIDSLPHLLSGGEQQRVAIARALVREPQLVLADEPTGALDLETGKQVMGLLKSMVAELNTTLVTITHDPAIAEQADSIYVLDQGTLERQQ